MKLHGNERRMRAAVEYAEKNGFEVTRTKNNHLMFVGYGVVITGASTPRSEFAADKTISRMRRAQMQDTLPPLQPRSLN